MLPVPAGGRVESRFRLERISASHRNELKSGIRYEYADQRRVQVLLVKNEKEHAWAINSRNID